MPFAFGSLVCTGDSSKNRGRGLGGAIKGTRGDRKMKGQRKALLGEVLGHSLLEKTPARVCGGLFQGQQPTFFPR